MPEVDFVVGPVLKAVLKVELGFPGREGRVYVGVRRVCGRMAGFQDSGIPAGDPVQIPGVWGRQDSDSTKFLWSLMD